MFGEVVGFSGWVYVCVLGGFGRAEIASTKFGFSDCSAQIVDLRCLDVARAECQMLLSAAPADIKPAITFAGKSEWCVGVESIEAREGATSGGCVRGLFFSITEHR